MKREELESQIIYYCLLSQKYIDHVFAESSVDATYFADEGNKEIVKIILSYYESYGKCIIKEELELVLKNKLNKKEIQEGEHLAASRSFKRAKEWDGILTETQFDRVFADFVSVVHNTFVREILVKNKTLLDTYKTSEYILKVNNEFDKIKIGKNEIESINVLDIYNDVEAQIKDLEDRRELGLTGIPTGIAAIDKIFGGFEKRTLSIIAAMVGTGKSTFVLNISKNIAEIFEKKVLVISLEMSDKQWARKYNSLDFWVPYEYLQRGNKELFNKDDFQSLKEKIEARKNKKRKGEYKVIDVPAGRYSFKELIRIKDRKLPAFKPDIIFIDQISLIRLPGRIDKRDELGDLTKQMIAYGKENDIAMVAVAQANRASIIRKNGKREIDINIENIEDSHKPGADAANVIAIMVPPGHGNDNVVNRILVRIIKQRDGATQTIEIQSRLDYCAMLDMESPAFGNDEDGEESEDDIRQEILLGDFGLDDTGCDKLKNLENPSKSNRDNEIPDLLADLSGSDDMNIFSGNSLSSIPKPLDDVEEDSESDEADLEDLKALGF